MRAARGGTRGARRTPPPASRLQPLIRLFSSQSTGSRYTPLNSVFALFLDECNCQSAMGALAVLPAGRARLRAARRRAGEAGRARPAPLIAPARRRLRGPTTRCCAAAAPLPPRPARPPLITFIFFFFPPSLPAEANFYSRLQTSLFGGFFTEGVLCLFPPPLTPRKAKFKFKA